MPGAHLLVAALMPVAAVSADIVPRTTQPPPSPRRSLDDQIRASCQSHSDFDGGSLLDISKRMFPDTAKLSPGCAAAVTTLQTHAATYDYAFPLSVMICSLGLFPGDTGDYYMCSQAVYGTDPKSTGDGRIRWAVRDAKYLSIPQNTSEYLRTPQQQACRGLLRARHNTQEKSAGFSYWQLVLASMDGHHRRRLQHHHHGGSDGVNHDAIGVCLPSACGAADVHVFEKVYVGPNGLQNGHLNVSLAGHHVNGTHYWLAPPNNPDSWGFGPQPFGLGGWLWICVTALLVLLATVATLPYPYGLHGMADSLQSKPPPAGAQQVNGEMRSSESGAAKNNLLVRCIACWDLNRNYQSLVKADAGHPGLRTLNGVRVIAILLVVLGHTFAFMPHDNSEYDYDVVKPRFFSTWWIGDDEVSIGVGFLSVDSFFFLSGFLFMWPQLRSYSISDSTGPGTKMPPSKFYWKTLLLRYLRLTPMYLYVLMIYIYVNPGLGNGPHWHSGLSDMQEEPKFCKELWWTNILYVSNLFPAQLSARTPRNEEGMNGEGELGCMIQTWYLSNDYQLCIVTPIVAILWKKKKLFAYGFLAAVLFVMHAIILAETMYYSVSVCDMKVDNPPYHESDGAPPHSGDFQILLYDKPWYRPGYFVGALLACLYIDFQREDGSLPPVPGGPLAVMVTWAVILFVMFYTSAAANWLVYDTYSSDGSAGEQKECAWSRVFDVAFSTFFRTAWCMAVAGMIWLGLTGNAKQGQISQGGPIVAFLSASFWTPVARLTFGVYLTHVMVFRLNYNSVQKDFDYTDYLGAFLLTANYTLALMASLFLYMLVEKPCANVVMLLLAPPRRSTSGRIN